MYYFVCLEIITVATLVLKKMLEYQYINFYDLSL